MSDVKFLHIAPPDHKFMLPLIAFMDKPFDIMRHKFLFLGGENDLDNAPQSHRIYGVNFLKFLPDFYSAEKIILHSILSSKMVIFLALQPWLLNKCHWIIWGADLHKYQEHTQGIKVRAYEFARRFIIKRFGYIMTGTRGDYELAKQWYGVQGQWIKTFNYPSNIFRPRPAPEKKEGAPKVVVSGNSAAPSNNHEKIFQIISPYVKRNIQVLCPLSYGGSHYEKEKAKVLEMGSLYLEDAFSPLTDFMPLETYLDYLAGADLALYAHKRQQGFGNTLFLLGMGKTVYMEPNSALHTVFKEYGLVVKNINRFDFTFLSKEEAEQNMRNVRSSFSEESLVESIKQWIT